MFSGLLFRDEVVRDARVLALVLKRGVFGEEVGGGEEGGDPGKEFTDGDKIAPVRSD